MGYNYKNYNNDNCKEKKEYPENSYMIQNHNHEFLTSTDYKLNDENVMHNHRIAGVTGPPIPIKCGKSHVHKVAEFTDTFIDHFHEICDTTGPALYLRDGKHIHLLKGETTPAEDNKHQHDYYFVTLIEDPSNVPEDNKC